ncbi:MAG: hypothetical protein QOE81_756 [Verrucomicrobiota bacterium]|jgi:membrane-associated phospholipid phosphatase
MLHDKARSALLLIAVFAANFFETWTENSVERNFLVNSNIGARCASAFQSMETTLTKFDFNNAFDFRGFSAEFIAYSASFAYFFLFPFIALGIALALARRTNAVYLRCFAYAIAVNYLISLPFYLFYPIPERWAFPDSEAVLLSDHISYRLIEAFRPISALDNCFPSSHVSITVILIYVAYNFAMPLKHFVLIVGLAVILSTYVLGIHWLPDIVAGVALGTVSWYTAVTLLVRRSKRTLMPASSLSLSSIK